jgi:transposase
MRGADSKQEGMFSYVSPESRISTNHPLRPIRAIVAEALVQMDRKLESLYSQNGRPPTAPERPIRALLLQVLYTIRSDRMLVEQLEYNLLFRWFVGLSVDEPVWGHSTFSKDRDRLFGADIARDLFESIIAQAHATGLLSDEHFSVDGTLIQAWASNRSYRSKDDSMMLLAAAGARLVTLDGYTLSLRARKLIEEAFGWGKDIGLLRQPKFRGRQKMEYAALLTFTGYNLRMRNLLAPEFGCSRDEWYQ